MRKLVLAFVILFATALPVISHAATPDFSGVYDCKGLDASEGAYSGKVTLKRVAAHSTAGYNAYQFTLEVPGYGIYRGHATGKGVDVAIYFAHEDPATRDYGTGLARFSKGKGGKWQFHKYYYEPEYKGGNHGSEDCVQQ
ncbi:MAG: hypothetical protein QM776_08370 [Rhodocyclaceae bacterium]